MIITIDRLNASIHYVPGTPIIYLNNAKVACSSIKKAMWLKWHPSTYEQFQNPHIRQGGPFCQNLRELAQHLDEMSLPTIFTVVRNPYVRILSAYLDKIGRKPRDAGVWFPFARRFGISGDAIPSFDEFLRMITSEEPSLLDQHFAPQYLNILQPFTSCHFVGHIEHMDTVWAFLGKYGIAQNDYRPHQTGAETLL